MTAASVTSTSVPLGLRSALLPRKHQAKERQEFRALLWAVHKSAHMLAWYAASELARFRRLAEEMRETFTARESEAHEKFYPACAVVSGEIYHFILVPDLLR